MCVYVSFIQAQLPEVFCQQANKQFHSSIVQLASSRELQIINYTQLFCLWLLLPRIKYIYIYIPVCTRPPMEMENPLQHLRNFPALRTHTKHCPKNLHFSQLTCIAFIILFVFASFECSFPCEFSTFLPDTFHNMASRLRQNHKGSARRC